MNKIYLLALFVMLALFAPAVYSQDVNVGLYLINLGKFDVSSGSFTADFYLSLTCEDNCSTDFEFVNGRAASVDKIIDKPNEKQYRIQANLVSLVDLKQFPFDEQKLTIALEDKSKTIDKVKYVPVIEESGMESTIAFAGWRIDGWNATSKEHYYQVYDETYSQYEFSVDISKLWFNSFLKTFLPVIIIILIVMMTFVMDPDKIATRLTVTSSSLLAAVMFHISIANQIPAVGYLTNADKFMILSYLVLLFSVVANITLLELHEQKKEKTVEKIHRSMEFSVFIVIPLVYLLFFFFFI